MVAAGEAKPFREHAVVDAVVALAVEDRVQRAMDVEQHPVASAPVGQRLVRGEAADEVVVHDDRRAELLRVLGAFDHLLDIRRRDVEVVTLALAGLLLGLAHGLHHERVAVAPAHEGLRGDVLVVLREVEAAGEQLVARATVVLRREAELRLQRRAEEGAPVLVERVPLDLDAVRRAGERLDVRDRDAQILEAERGERLEPEDVAGDRGHHARDRAFLEEIHRIRDEREHFVVAPRDGLDRVRARLVALERGEVIRPDARPRARGRLGRDRRRGLFRRHAALGVMRNAARTSVSRGSYPGVQYVSR